MPPESTEELTSAETHRTLTGWLPEDEGIQLLLGRVPTPADDVAAIRRQLSDRRAAVADREPYGASDPMVEPEGRSGLDAVSSRPEVRAAFEGMDWRVTTVNLESVLSVQKAIRVSGLDERMARLRQDGGALLEFCLPSEQPSSPARAFADVDGRGVTMSSPNPNLRLAGMQVVQPPAGPDAPPVQEQGLMVLVQLKASYLQVARYHGRHFLIDGYHRAAGLLRAGITTVPCVFIEAQSFEQVVSMPGLFTYETVFADRPPRLVDFWDPEVSDDVVRPAVRKVIRVRGDEFVVEG